MVIFNRSAKWTGNYTTANIGQVTMEVNAPGPSDLHVRLVVSNGAAGSGTKWVSTVACDVTAGNSWQTCVFPLSAADMTQQLGSATFATVMSNVAELRIVSAVTPNGHLGDRIVAQMDIDNVAPQTPTAVTMSQQTAQASHRLLLMVVVFILLSGTTIWVYGREIK